MCSVLCHGSCCGLVKVLHPSSVRCTSSPNTVKKGLQLHSISLRAGGVATYCHQRRCQRPVRPMMGLECCSPMWAGLSCVPDMCCTPLPLCTAGSGSASNCQAAKMIKSRPCCWAVSCQNPLQQLNDQSTLPELKCIFLLQVAPDMKAGLWMICQACRERNYLHAYDIYMRLAIGEGL